MSEEKLSYKAAFLFFAIILKTILLRSGIIYIRNENIQFNRMQLKLQFLK